jgi:glycosyltransferase involved in cell wall biosynthesis
VEKMIPILSILTPAVPSRLSQIQALIEQVHKQNSGNVEHLVLIDNKARTVGEKRDALLVSAKGKYVAFVDDDDWISDDYVSEIVKAAQSAPDVITFLQEATIDDQKGIVEFRLGNPNDPFRPNSPGVTRRNAWHVCAWRRARAILSHFPISNYGEDWAFAAPLCALPNLREVHIDKVLHFYRHSSKTTEAPPPLTAAKS